MKFRWLFIAMLAAPMLLHSDDKEPIEKMIQKADAAGDHQAELYAKVVRREIELAADAYKSGDAQKTSGNLHDADIYADKALASAQQAHKHLKQAEIALRESSRKLFELDRSMALEDRPPAEETLKHLQSVDSELLQLMLGVKHK